jgi:prophage antirepressor-like protein
MGDTQYAYKAAISDENGVCRMHWILTEAGLFKYLATSRTKIGQKLSKWIFIDVLPNIRKTGKYEVDAETKLKLADLNRRLEKSLSANSALKESLAKSKATVQILQENAEKNFNDSVFTEMKLLKSETTIQSMKDDAEEVQQTLNTLDKEKKKVAANRKKMKELREANKALSIENSTLKGRWLGHKCRLRDWNRDVLNFRYYHTGRAQSNIYRQLQLEDGKRNFLRWMFHVLVTAQKNVCQRVWEDAELKSHIAYIMDEHSLTLPYEQDGEPEHFIVTDEELSRYGVIYTADAKRDAFYMRLPFDEPLPLGAESALPTLYKMAQLRFPDVSEEKGLSKEALLFYSTRFNAWGRKQLLIPALSPLPEMLATETGAGTGAGTPPPKPVPRALSLPGLVNEFNMVYAFQHFIEYMALAVIRAHNFISKQLTPATLTSLLASLMHIKLDEDYRAPAAACREPAELQKVIQTIDDGVSMQYNDTRFYTYARNLNRWARRHLHVEYLTRLDEAMIQHRGIKRILAEVRANKIVPVHREFIDPQMYATRLYSPQK